MAITFRSSIRQRKYEYLINAGFMPAEARELSRTSRTGMRSPYFSRMVQSRRRTVDNLIRLGRSSREIQDYIKRQYVERKFIKRDSMGRLRIDVWQLLRYHEDAAFRRGEEYESPWRKRTRRKATKKRTTKRISKKDMLRSMIKRIDRQIASTGNDTKRERLEETKYGYERELKRLEALD